MYPIYDLSDDEDSAEHTVVENKPHWSTLKRKFIAAFSAITVIRPSQEDHHAAKMNADELLVSRESLPELTNARWTAKLDMARMHAAQVEHDAEVSMFKHWKLAVREQELQEESEPLPSVSIAAPYVVREQRHFYSFAEAQAAQAMATFQVRRVPKPFAPTKRTVAMCGAIAGVLVAIACVAATGGSPAAMASSRPTMFPMFADAPAKTAAPITMRAIAQPVQLTTEPTRLPPVEHRFAPVAEPLPTIAPIVETAPAVVDEAPAPKKMKRHISKSSRASVSVSERAPAKSMKSGKRRPIVVNTSTALGDLRPSRR